MNLRMPVIYEYTAGKLPRDLSFLIIGGVLMPAVGWPIMRAGSGDVPPRGEGERS